MVGYQNQYGRCQKVTGIGLLAWSQLRFQWGKAPRGLKKTLCMSRTYFFCASITTRWGQPTYHPETRTRWQRTTVYQQALCVMIFLSCFCCLAESRTDCSACDTNRNRFPMIRASDEKPEINYNAECVSGNLGPNYGEVTWGNVGFPSHPLTL